MKKYLVVTVAVFIIGIGCKKNSDEKTICRISKIINSLGNETEITYTPDGKIEKVKSGNVDENVNFSYVGDSIVRVRSNAITGTRKTRTIQRLNSSGMLYTQKVEFFNPTGTTVTNSVTNNYEYAGTQLVKSTRKDSSYSLHSTSSSAIDYTWADGNLKSSIAGLTISQYEYYLEQQFQQADIESVRFLVSGNDMNLLIRNKNLTKSTTEGSWTYEFDPAGKIKTIFLNGQLAYRIEYDCN